jgi:NCS1 family nucleobase:cation symporter-1
MCPWQLLSSAATSISVLSAYSVFLGPLVGIQICDYWIIRRRRIKLSDLYHAQQDGLFHYWHGVNPRAFVAWACGFASQLPGFANAINKNIVVPIGCVRLYYLAFPLGFVISFGVFYALNMLMPLVGLGDMDKVDIFGTFSSSEALRLGIAPNDGIMGQDVDGKDGNRVEEKDVKAYP